MLLAGLLRQRNIVEEESVEPPRNDVERGVKIKDLRQANHQ